MDAPDGLDKKKWALRFVVEHPGSPTDKVARALEVSNGFAFSCLSGLWNEGKVKPELVEREDPKEPRRRLWFPV